MKKLILILCCAHSLMAQKTYSPSNAHSHNDYEQAIPFNLAYQQGFGSVEADVFYRNDSLFVAHEYRDIRPERTLEKLYLEPIAALCRKNGGTVYKDPSKQLQLLVDLKTGSEVTLGALVKSLQPYASLLAPAGSVKVVVSGNTPKPEKFGSYPDFIFFDGRPEIAYTPEQLKRVGLISQSFGSYSKWNGKGIPVEKDRKALQAVIEKIHASGKPVRFWATPDEPNTWKVMMNMGVDYINTDRVNELGSFLSKRASSEYMAATAYVPYQPTYQNNDSRGKVKNIILLVGDGMGLAQIHAGLTANRGRLNLSSFLNIGFSKTASSDNYITDSAAGATAFSTGKKTRNRAIGVDSNLVAVSALPSLIRPLGMKTALISAGDITDATPAAFYAHQPDRSMQKEIALDYVQNPVDILIGGGAAHFVQTGADKALQQKGIRFSVDRANLNEMTLPFALLDDKQALSMQKGRGAFLSDSFRKSASLLEKNSKGFFMMAEGAQIDYGGHANVVSYVVTEMLDFDRLVGEALKFADTNGETLVIVTADHETGGLTLLDGRIRDGYVDGHFSTTDHTGIMVPVFAYGPHSLDFRGVYENTAIFEKLMAVIKSQKHLK